MSQKMNIQDDEAVNGWELIYGTNNEFCVVAYAALLKRLPDPAAINHYRSLPIDVDTRIQEIHRILDSGEYKSKGVRCVLEAVDTPIDLLDQTFRLNNFMRFILPYFVNALIENRDLIEIRASEIADLMRELLFDVSTNSAFNRPAIGGLDRQTADQVDALTREVEALRLYVQYDLPRNLLRQLSHTILINNVEIERQIRHRG